MTGEVVTIAAEEGRIGNAVETATARSITADIWLRVAMVVVVCGIFIWLNWRVIDFVQQALALDLERMQASPPLPPEHRLVTSHVVMALIGATVVQTGIGFIAITSYLFPKRLNG